MTDLFARISDQRLALCELLDGLEPSQWSTPSLCGGWTVREVVAHLVMPFEVSVPVMAWRLVVARGDFDKVTDRFARHQSDRPVADLVSKLRANAGNTFTPPGLGPEAPLTDIIVHGLDIAVPTGVSLRVPAASVNFVLSFLTTAKASRGFVPRGRLSGLRFESLDTGWSGGGGLLVRGSAQSLALAMTGRAREGELSGDGAVELLGRINRP